MSDEGSAGMTQFDVEAECPACGAAFKVPRIRRGSTEACPVCRYMVRVGGEGAYEEHPAEVAGPPRRPPEPAAAQWQDERPQATAPARATGNCIVCTRDDEQVNPLAVGPIVREMTGAPAIDVRRPVVRGQGVLAEGVPAAKAGELAARLSGLQVPAFAVAEEAMPVVERDLHIITVRGATDDALQVQVDFHGTVTPLAWRAVLAGFSSKEQPRVISQPEPEEHMYFVGGGPAVASGSRFKSRAAKREARTDVECTLLVRGRSGSAYTMRFADRKVRYNYLGSRRQSSMARNFALFLTDVIRRCPDAFFPASTQAVAAGQMLKVAKMQQPGDYERYLKWVLCCVGARSLVRR